MRFLSRLSRRHSMVFLTIALLIVVVKAWNVSISVPFFDQVATTATAEVYATPPAQPAVLGEQDQRGLESVVVKKVIDGDTIQLGDGRTVRYIGMDTPETHHPTKGVECFGPEAAAYNTKLVEGKTVQLEKDISETDRYDRLLRYVWLNDELLNEKLVRDGYAFARSFPPDIARQDQLRAAETNAREAQRGLWAGCQVKSNRTQQIAKP